MRDWSVESEAAQDGELVGGVNTLDVVGGVGFCVAVRLGLSKGVREEAFGAEPFA